MRPDGGGTEEAEGHEVKPTPKRRTAAMLDRIAELEAEVEELREKKT